MIQEIIDLFISTFWMILGIAGIFAIYLIISAVCWSISKLLGRASPQKDGFTALKTVTFGDESAVNANRIASIAAVITIFVLWALATGSNLLPFSLPKAFIGETQITYTATNAAGETDDAIIYLNVSPFGQKADKPVPSDADTGFAKNDIATSVERRSKLVRAKTNDEGGDQDGYRITAIEGQPIEPGKTVPFTNGTIFMTNSGSLSIRPNQGMTMEALYMPPPEQVWTRFWDLNANGYQAVGLWENVFWSLARVIIGFALGCLFGIPLGYAMGLNSWLRGWFDPIVEFMRPVPPLALIPLVIIWFGIGEEGKISLLFLAALWIMTIAARSGVSGVNISKVHAAYSLGAKKRQVLSKVIMPNSLPEIFTGARVAMGVCWGTVVASELVAAEKGAGKMIIAASKFQLTDIVIIGIIIIGIIGYMIDVLMRQAEARLVPWKGKG